MSRVFAIGVGVALVLSPPTVMLAAVTNEFLAGTYTEPGTGLQLPYRLFVPLNYDPAKKYPLLLFLHGSGESGTNNTAQLSHVGSLLTYAKMPAYSCFLLAPQTNSGWAAGGQNPSSAIQMTLNVIDQLETQYSIDSKRHYVTGLSMGGYGTWETIWQNRDLFAAAAPVCGGGDVSKAPLLVDEPIWAFHNAGDETVSATYSREMIEAIVAAGGTPRYTEYPKTGHNAWDAAYGNPELYAWMFSQGVPEPATFALMLGGGLGIGGHLGWRRFRKRRQRRSPNTAT